VVFNRAMTRPRLALAALAAAAVGVPAAPASAKITELGKLSGTPPPTCPQKKNPVAPSDFCRIVTRTTGYQVRAGRVKAPVTVPSAGRVVAFTLSLGDLSAAQIKRADGIYGGASRVRLTALRKVKGRTLYRSVVGQSRDVKTAPFFGTTTQFAMSKAIPVRKGDIIAVTVPTWAPMLALGLAESNSWRTSRTSGDCDDFVTQTAMTTLKGRRRFGCTYTTARLTYTATFIPRAKPTYDRNHRPIMR
jgi:hypothetical protein